MTDEQSLSTFISRLARKIAIVYPDSYADVYDYIQEGHLKLAELNKNQRKQHDFRGYAIISIARAMRRAAINTMYAASAPYGVKKKARILDVLLAAGRTEKEICQELGLSKNEITILKTLINTESWQELFNEPAQDSNSFLMLQDILSSHYLTEKDKIFIQAQVDDIVDSLGLSRKQQWTKSKNIRAKLERSGYGTATN